MTAVRPITTQVISKTLNSSGIVKINTAKNIDKPIIKISNTVRKINLNSQSQGSENFASIIAKAIKQILQTD